MNNVYHLYPKSATSNFIFPQSFIEFFRQYPSFFQQIFRQERKMIGDEAFYKKYSELAAYQIYLGILDLKNIPGRKEFWDFYNKKES